jgi:hypothetical protein
MLCLNLLRHFECSFRFMIYYLRFMILGLVRAEIVNRQS